MGTKKEVEISNSTVYNLKKVGVDLQTELVREREGKWLEGCLEVIFRKMKIQNCQLQKVGREGWSDFLFVIKIKVKQLTYNGLRTFFIDKGFMKITFCMTTDSQFKQTILSLWSQDNMEIF